MKTKVPWSSEFKKDQHLYGVDKESVYVPRFEKDYIFDYSGIMRNQFISIEIEPREQCWYINYSTF